MALIPVNDRGYRVGEKHHRSTIPDNIVDQIRDLHEESGRSYAWLAMKFGLPCCTISKLCRYERRAQIPVRMVIRT